MYCTIKGYLSGLIDGEGSFSISKGGQPKFMIKLRADDRPLLESLQEELGMGNIRYVKDPGHQRNRNNNPCVIWSLNTISECNRLAHILSKPGTRGLRGKKAQEFALWNKCLSVKMNAQYSAATKRRRVEEIREALVATREYDPTVSADQLINVRN